MLRKTLKITSKTQKIKKFLYFFEKNRKNIPHDLQKHVVNKVRGKKSFLDFDNIQIQIHMKENL